MEFYNVAGNQSKLYHNFVGHKTLNRDVNWNLKPICLAEIVSCVRTNIERAIKKHIYANFYCMMNRNDWIHVFGGRPSKKSPKSIETSGFCKKLPFMDCQPSSPPPNNSSHFRTSPDVYFHRVSSFCCGNSMFGVKITTAIINSTRSRKSFCNFPLAATGRHRKNAAVNYWHNFPYDDNSDFCIDFFREHFVSRQRISLPLIERWNSLLIRLGLMQSFLTWN